MNKSQGILEAEQVGGLAPPHIKIYSKVQSLGQEWTSWPVKQNQAPGIDSGIGQRWHCRSLEKGGTVFNKWCWDKRLSLGTDKLDFYLWPYTESIQEKLKA